MHGYASGRCIVGPMGWAQSPGLKRYLQWFLSCLNVTYSNIWETQSLKRANKSPPLPTPGLSAAVTSPGSFPPAASEAHQLSGRVRLLTTPHFLVIRWRGDSGGGGRPLSAPMTPTLNGGGGGGGCFWVFFTSLKLCFLPRNTQVSESRGEANTLTEAVRAL